MRAASLARVLRFVVCLVLCSLSASRAEGPQIEILSPQPGQHVRQLETLRVVARTAQAVATRTISLSAGGTVVKTLPTPAPWQQFIIDWPLGERAPGICSLRLSAVTVAGARLQSSPVQVVVDEAPWYPAPRDRSYALLIGVGQYEDTGISTLSCAAADVKAIYGVLTDPAAGAYPPGNVMMLTDDAPDERKPRRNNILDLLKNWLGRVGKDADSVLVYFSGHGIEEGGKGYLVPRDARIGILSDTGVDLERVNQLLQETNARVKVLFLDACHSAAGKDLRVEMAPTVSDALFAGGEGRVTLASCKTYQRSWEWPAKGQSVFTYYLAEALAGAADADRNRQVTLDEVSRYVHGRVMAWAAENRKEQEPRLKADVSGEVVLAGLTPGRPPVRITGTVATAAVAPAPAPPALARPRPDAGDLSTVPGARLRWYGVWGGGSADETRSTLQRIGDGANVIVGAIGAAGANLDAAAAAGKQMLPVLIVDSRKPDNWAQAVDWMASHVKRHRESVPAIYLPDEVYSVGFTPESLSQLARLCKEKLPGVRVMANFRAPEDWEKAGGVPDNVDILCIEMYPFTKDSPVDDRASLERKLAGWLGKLHAVARGRKAILWVQGFEGPAHRVPTAREVEWLCGILGEDPMVEGILWFAWSSARNGAYWFRGLSELPELREAVLKQGQVLLQRQ